MVNVFSGLDRALAIASVAERRTRSDDLVAEIADALATAGEYVTRIDVLPTQHAVDFNWAAQQAGRRLGIRVSVEVQRATVAPDGRAAARVTPVRPPD